MNSAGLAGEETTHDFLSNQKESESNPIHRQAVIVGILSVKVRK
jgi:hypothetical protein